MMFQELDTVRITRLPVVATGFTGSASALRAPTLGDTGVVVHAADGRYVVESVQTDGRTVWLAEFAASDLELVDRRDE